MRKRPRSPGQASRLAAHPLYIAIVSILAASAAVAQAPDVPASNGSTTAVSPYASSSPGVSSASAQAQAQAQAQASPSVQPPLIYGVDAGIAETDNVNLAPSNRVSQTIALADVDFDLKKQTRLLNADAKGDFSYLDYIQGAYKTELLGRFDGSLRATLLPDHLTWVLQDDFGQAALDPFVPTTPTNLQNENYFSTGPDLAFLFGGTEFLNLGARYARTTFQSSPFNSNRLQGSIAVGLQFSARSSASLNADTERVMFTDTAVNTDYDRTNVFLRYEAQGARTELQADIGATRVALPADEHSPEGPLARLTVSRKLSAAATLSLTAGSVLTDASTAFSGTQSGAIGVVGPALAPITASSYTSNFASLGWNYVRNRTTLAASGRWEKDTYEGDPALDVRRLVGELSATRQLTRSFSAQVLGRISKTDYLNATVTSALASPNASALVIPNTSPFASTNYDNDLIAAVLTWRYGRGLEIKLRAEHDAQISSGFDTGYKDNRAFLTIGYRPNVQPATTLADPNLYPSR